MLVILFLSLFPADPTPWLPPLSDRDRFPDAETCREQMRRWQSHFDWLTRHPPPERLDDQLLLTWWIEQARECRDAWNAADSIYCTSGASPRKRLAELRDTIGQCRYHLGSLPPRLPDLNYGGNVRFR